MVGSQQVTVGTDAVLLASAPAGPAAGPVAAVLLLADASVDVFLGGPHVSTTNGLKVTHAVTTPVQIPLFAGDQLYAVVATGTATVGVLEV